MIKDNNGDEIIPRLVKNLSTVNEEKATRHMHLKFAHIFICISDEKVTELQYDLDKRDILHKAEMDNRG